MRLVERLGRHSAIYTVATILQRGTAFVLVPLYTHVLAPAEYGTIALITALNGVLVVLLPMSLYGAINRFYFEYRDQPEVLREFWGTVLTAMALSCLVFGGLLLTAGRPLIAWMLGDVPLWPYVAIGVGTAAVQPFFQAVLAILQVREQPVRFAAISLGHFLVTLSVTLYLILGAGWQAAGPLTAMLGSSILFAVVGVFLLRRDFVLCLRLDFLKSALAYTLPHIPHGLAAQMLTASDRFLLNGLISLAAAGVYNIAALFSLAVDLVAQSVNRAYVPLAMSALQSNEKSDLEQVSDAGTTVVIGFCIIGLTLTVFSNEIVAIIAGHAFEAAVLYVPFLAFAGTASAIYYVLVNILFFDRKATKLIPLGTGLGAFVSVALNYVLIKAYGAIGAAVATMTAQLLTTIVIGAIAYRFEPIRWNYRLFAAAYVIAFVGSTTLASVHLFGIVIDFALRVAGWALLVMTLNLMAWRDPLHLARQVLRVISSHPAFQKSRPASVDSWEDPLG